MKVYDTDKHISLHRHGGNKIHRTRFREFKFKLTITANFHQIMACQLAIGIPMQLNLLIYKLCLEACIQTVVS